MTDVHVRFDGSGVTSADIACMALQPVLDSVYHRYGHEPLPAVERALDHAGRGAFAQDGITSFAGYISAGHRPVLTSGGPRRDQADRTTTAKHATGRDGDTTTRSRGDGPTRGETSERREHVPGSAQRVVRRPGA